MIPHKPPLLNFLLHPMTTLTQGKTQQKSNFPLSAWLSACGQGWNSCCTWAAQPDECDPRTDLPHARVCFRPWFTLVLLTSRSQNDSWAGLVVPPVPSAAQCSTHDILPMLSRCLQHHQLQKGLVSKWCIHEKNSIIITIWVSAILPNTINHGEQHGKGQQQVWAGPD